MLLKRREAYSHCYSKDEAVLLLLRDPRVDSIQQENSRFNNMTIYTKPIQLKPTHWRIKPFIIGPIGKYQIILTSLGGLPNYPKRLTVDINRIGGPVDVKSHHSYSSFRMHSTHISNEWGEKICWGSSGGDIHTTRMNHDWFWTAKISLDLINDNNPERHMASLYKSCNILLQLKYAIETHNKKAEKRIRMINDKYKVFKISDKLDKRLFIGDEDD